MATNNSVNTGLSGTTGTVNFVGSTSPTLVTPTLGVATATSVTFNPTTGGTVGTTTNNNTTAGNVGELISSVISSGSAVTFTNTVTRDLTSISLTAGDWDVSGNITYAGTVLSSGNSWISLSSATVPDLSLLTQSPGGSLTATSSVAPFFRASLSGTTTIYLSGTITGTGTLTGQGGLFARRRR